MHLDVKYLNGYYNYQRQIENSKKIYKNIQQRGSQLEFLKVKTKTLINNWRKCKKSGREKKNVHNKNKRNKEHKRDKNNKVNGSKREMILITQLIIL